jgi:hypothetical protein
MYPWRAATTPSLFVQLLLWLSAPYSSLCRPCSSLLVQLQGDDILETLHLCKQSAYLIGREKVKIQREGARVSFAERQYAHPRLFNLFALPSIAPLFGTLFAFD